MARLSSQARCAGDEELRTLAERLLEEARRAEVPPSRPEASEPPPPGAMSPEPEQPGVAAQGSCPAQNGGIQVDPTLTVTPDDPGGPRRHSIGKFEIPETLGEAAWVSCTSLCSEYQSAGMSPSR